MKMKYGFEICKLLCNAANNARNANENRARYITDVIDHVREADFRGHSPYVFVDIQLCSCFLKGPHEYETVHVWGFGHNVDTAFWRAMWQGTEGVMRNWWGIASISVCALAPFKRYGLTYDLYYHYDFSDAPIRPGDLRARCPESCVTAKDMIGAAREIYCERHPDADEPRVNAEMLSRIDRAAHATQMWVLRHLGKAEGQNKRTA